MPFEVDQTIIEKYTHPPTCTVEEVFKSPIKTQVNVKGILRKASDIMESPNSVRREVTLESLEGSSRIVCKLWGEKSDAPLPPPENIIIISNMEVSSYRDVLQLNSTILTSIQETTEDIEFTGEIEGVDFRKDFSYIIVASMSTEPPPCLKIRTDQLDRIFPSQKFKPGIFVKGTAKGLTVVEMKEYNPNKKPRTE
ncbi:uncharacterized protein LOC125678014 [Ostrea edulis]|uniref:uncharacterized protein LOC125678014 n=1 Tax=Ostrea edulis TaxID=37623 RepID=UPI0024AFC4A0|nr:uncharacterized protein LOC125678014 [Ostrea edulis]